MALNPPGPGDDGSSWPPPPPPPPPTPRPMLFLDSGACFHMVSDARLLTNLHDAPAGMAVTVADGNTLPVAKIGDIQIITAGFSIPGVFLVPGLNINLISVHQLSRIRICTWFDGGRALLYAGPKLVGVAFAPRNLVGPPYLLQFLRMPVCCGSWARTPWLKPELPPLNLLPMHGDNGSSSPSSGPKLLLDSGASFHVVSDPRLLCNLRDAPAGMSLRAGDGSRMHITKIGDIHMITAGFSIPSVGLVPGLKFDGLISVHQLAREGRICTWIVGDQAKLYVGPELVGVAVAPKENLAGIYVLQFLRTPNIASASSRYCLDGRAVGFFLRDPYYSWFLV